MALILGVSARDDFDGYRIGDVAGEECKLVDWSPAMFWQGASETDGTLSLKPGHIAADTDNQSLMGSDQTLSGAPFQGGLFDSHVAESELIFAPLCDYQNGGWITAKGYPLQWSVRGLDGDPPVSGVNCIESQIKYRVDFSVVVSQVGGLNTILSGSIPTQTLLGEVAKGHEVVVWNNGPGPLVSYTQHSNPTCGAGDWRNFQLSFTLNPGTCYDTCVYGLFDGTDREGPDREWWLNPEFFTTCSYNGRDNWTRQFYYDYRLPGQFSAFCTTTGQREIYNGGFRRYWSWYLLRRNAPFDPQSGAPESTCTTGTIDTIARNPGGVVSTRSIPFTTVRAWDDNRADSDQVASTTWWCNQDQSGNPAPPLAEFQFRMTINHTQQRRARPLLWFGDPHPCPADADRFPGIPEGDCR